MSFGLVCEYHLFVIYTVPKSKEIKDLIFLLLLCKFGVPKWKFRNNPFKHQTQMDPLKFVKDYSFTSLWFYYYVCLHFTYYIPIEKKNLYLFHKVDLLENFYWTILKYTSKIV